jgi:uncharacterized cupredoxin-like copper-binding protein
MQHALWIALLLALLWAGAARAFADEVLFDFDKDFDVATVTATDATVSLAKAGEGAALAVATGHTMEWPGIILKAPKGAWDLSKFTHIAVNVKNTGTSAVTVNCRVDNAGADGVNHCVTDRVTLKPGEAGTLTVRFVRRPPALAGVKLFGMRGYPVAQDAGGAIDPAKVTQLVIFVATPDVDHAFEIDNVRAAGAWTAPPEPALDPAKFFPFIDRFGQYVHREWPGKMHAITDLEEAKKEEASNLKSRPGPKDWDAYGGWKAGPALKATGFFRTEKVDGAWWLVDPEGRLFFSHGVDCVGEHGETPIEERDNWFDDLPTGDPAYKEFFSTAYALHGYYKGRNMKCFDFAGANAKRKYGPNWKEKVAELAHQRLRSWGMNTIANWSDSYIYLMKKTPYTATVHFTSRPIQGSQGYWGQFKDPFESEFAEKVRASMAREKDKTAGDAWCLGYFVDNEIAWGDDVSLAVASLQSPPDQASKKAFIEDLKARYGEIGKLNAAWGTGHASWDALASSTAAPDKKKAAEDLGAFYTRIAEQYFKVIRDAVKEVAPNQLYLGCRFAWVNDRASRAGSKFCDVVSYNRYEKSVAALRLPAGSEDKPLIIGEFHFGALDRGMFHTGLVPTASQEERAATYKAYVQGALKNPAMVGTHWFKYQDEPTTGRPYDEENYQIGFLDITDRPYPETIAACREVGYDMYNIRRRAAGSGK